MRCRSCSASAEAPLHRSVNTSVRQQHMSAKHMLSRSGHAHVTQLLPIAGGDALHRILSIFLASMHMNFNSERLIVYSTELSLFLSSLLQKDHTLMFYKRLYNVLIKHSYREC
ncbi:hypothetical protein M378DRAFT_751466 [Amanita muscaria Koide BX008]|uniref:Uncharacterized protein n=1 Tax=Amanita muscaria (strain Koide BX008) TaxID=946122 RepID=A0A0C2SHJ5_AMAMK|nr:hypothetical protein M378DRAFT_751466 [Amanita muscaria Koide BX008]